MRRSGYRRGNLSRLGGMVKNSLHDLGLDGKVLQHQAAAKWREVVGPQIAASSVVENVRDGVLFICCKSSVWSAELSFHKDDIVKRLNTSVGRKVITDIRFSARGFRKVVSEAKKSAESTEAKGLDAVQISQTDQEIARKVAAIAPTEEMAAKIEKAILTSKRLTELKRNEGWKTCPKCSSLHNASSDLCINCR